jgi:hypothetical protein
VPNRSQDSRRQGVAAAVRRLIETGGERLWRLEDFRDLPFDAVAKTLQRLTREGLLERLSKGVYYHGRPTAFGRSRPNPAAVQRLAARTKDVFPAGLGAASLLGFTTQSGARAEVATSAGSLPRKLVGNETVVYTRRPAAWAGLSDRDAALLDFFRHSNRFSELGPEETTRKTLELLSERGRFERLLAVSATEPPRVRALLGALGEHLGKRANVLRQLRSSLNPLSRFDFGVYIALPNAKAWQAKDLRR